MLDAGGINKKSCHRIKIGKMYSKVGVVPSVLHGVETVNMREM